MSAWNKAHLKVILIGNSGVGKSSFMNQYVNHRFTNTYRATIGADFLTKEITVDGRLIVLQIWDTAGTERFQSLGNALYRGAHCCLLLFDVSSMTSFSSLSDWLKEFLVQADPPEPTSFPFVVIGNKTDLRKREVPQRLALDWCKKVGAKYFEGSAKEGVDVDKPFQTAARAALQRYNTHTLESTGRNIQIKVEQVDDTPKAHCLC
ncbi:ras-related protein Rab-7a isoform X2 [Paramormyrops kingsleyae]|uniref:Ras-related protein Rab-7b n=1 Tax=Paramormyrops kingsleyae TaxID=1676925 RepID=A0A3B3S5R1_9TELE|nr:ras-related protein Rab-7a-like isoform X3 [Paramormyrops kingsleyae]